MTGYYCSKCDRLNPGPVCEGCGKSLTTSVYRHIWTILRVPASDTLTWKTVICVLLALVTLLTIICFAFCAISGEIGRFVSMLPFILGVFPLGAVLVLIDLLLQGRESVWYTMEYTGVRIARWHKPSRLHSWSRLQTYDEKKICPQPDGSELVMSNEVSLAWNDVCKVKLSPRNGRIYLYHTPHMSPVILCIPEEDYESVEAAVKKRCKNKVAQ
ncbi:MAG: hypothetical protein CW338_03740 [Clostridiales bacterium]|nr:hypothetical protein [Clostridiales bacterium]